MIGSILKDVLNALEPLDIPIETGKFSDKACEKYIVITPIGDSFEVYADNLPKNEVQEARLSLFSKGNYQAMKNVITKTLMLNDFSITDRRYLGYEKETGYHHYVIDISKIYETDF